MTMDELTRNDDAGDAAVRLRAGMKVRVINPRSPHYGNTGHLLGRNERREPYWLVRFTTTTTSADLLAEELLLIR